MAGELKASLIGIFPKIELEFRHLTSSEMKSLLALLKPAVLSVSWWDAESESYKTGNFYAGDFSYSKLHKDLDRYDKFTVSLIPYKKMS